MKTFFGASLLLLALNSADALSSTAKTNSLKLRSVSNLNERPVRRNILESRHPTELKMSAVPVAAITGALTGGLFAGGLHAIAGR